MALISNWNDAEKLLHHAFYNELRVTPEEHPTVFIEPPLNPKDKREKLTSILFETYNIPALMLPHEAMCSMVCTGKQTGVVLESGLTSSIATCVFDYYPLTFSSTKSKIGGMDVTDYLIRLLSLRGYEMTTSAEKSIVKDIKKKLCYVSLDLNEELKEKSEETVQYELPDGSMMSLQKERFLAPEVLFDTTKLGILEMNLPEIIMRSAKCVDQEIQDFMFHHIVLSGGNTLFKGLPNRLHFELECYSDREDIQIFDSGPEKAFLATNGALVVSECKAFQSLWISKDDYDDVGPTVSQRMHF